MKTSIVEKKTVEYTVNLELTLEEAYQLRNILGCQHDSGLQEMLHSQYPKIPMSEVVETNKFSTQLFNAIADKLEERQ